jgi:hypothetical protein
MNDLTVECTYFASPGERNTERTLQIAGSRAEELGIRPVLVASTSGDTGVRAVEILGGHTVVVVTHSTGFRGPNQQELTDENRRILEGAGVHIVTCQHAFGGVGRAVRKRLKTYQVDEIIAYTLRVFGEGTKVICEMALMAADAGAIRTNQPVVGVAGTGRGADTAIVLNPTNAQTFFDLQIMEILCKPRFGPPT